MATPTEARDFEGGMTDMPAEFYARGKKRHMVEWSNVKPALFYNRWPPPLLLNHSTMPTPHLPIDPHRPESADLALNRKRVKILQKAIETYLPTWLSVMIAGIALGGTIYSSYLQRKAYYLSISESAHNRNAQKIAVRPLVNLVLDLSFTESDQGGIFVQNIGLGPALIISQTFMFNDKVYRPDRGEPFTDLVKYDAPWFVSPLTSGGALAAGQRKLLVGFSKEDLTPERKAFFINSVAPKLSWSAEYCSVFMEHWQAYVVTKNPFAVDTRLDQMPDLDINDKSYSTIKHNFPDGQDSTYKMEPRKGPKSEH